ncbi:MAG: prolipoprotein diacylglyceryl transferase [bacterium]
MFQVPRLPVPAYPLGLLLAFTAGLILVRREARRRGLDPVQMTDLGIYVVLLSLVGARALHVLADGDARRYLDQCVAQSPADCLAVFRFWEGGLVFYGGLLLALGFAVAYVRRRGLALWRVADLFGLALPLGLTFGRLGCHFHGCCFGAPTRAAWGVSFPPGSDASTAQAAAGLLSDAARHSLAVHPTQLLSVGLNLGIFLALYFGLRPRQRFEGQLMCGFLLLYGPARFAVEALRADARGGVGPLSTSQLISLLLVAGAAVAWTRLSALTMKESTSSKTG